MQLQVILDKCELEHTELFGLRAYHQAHVLLDQCTLRYNHRAVAFDDAATVFFVWFLYLYVHVFRYDGFFESIASWCHLSCAAR